MPFPLLLGAANAAKGFKAARALQASQGLQGLQGLQAPPATSPPASAVVAQAHASRRRPRAAPAAYDVGFVFYAVAAYTLATRLLDGKLRDTAIAAAALALWYLILTTVGAWWLGLVCFLLVDLLFRVAL